MKPATPPRWAARLLGSFGHPDTREEVQGDLLELYVHWVQAVGKRRADWRYSLSALKLLRPLAKLKRASEYSQPFFLHPNMLRNYFKIAWRNLTHAKTFSLINGFGLTLGMACALLVFVVVHHETHYDQHHKNGDRVYRVETANVRQNDVHAGTFVPMVDVLRNEVPEVERVVPFYQAWGQSVGVLSEGHFFKENVIFADPGVFGLLDFQWVLGDARTALSRPNQVVLTESYAEKLFGTVDVVGKTIRFNNNQDLQVTGVLRDHPTTTNFPLNVLVSFPTLKQASPDYDTHGWDGFGDNFQVFVLLKKGIRPEQLTHRFEAVQTKYQKDPETVRNQDFVLNPLNQLHYGFNFSGRQANPQLLNMLSVIGAFVLLLACINFINLTTAKALKRAKEIGIRKAIGSNRLALVGQFMTEAGLLTLLSALLALLLAWAALPATANLMGLPLKTPDLFSPQVGAFAAGLFALTALLAGTYPAFRLSGMSPIRALKSSKMAREERGTALRQGLVVVQFTVSMVLICGTLFMNRQLSFFQTANLGFNKNALVTVGLPDNRPEKLQALREQLMASPQIKDVCFSFNSPSAESNWMMATQYRKSSQPIEIRTQLKMGDAHFLSTYGIELLAGEAFREGDTTSANVLANQVFIKRVGINRPQDAIGQKIYYGDGPESMTITGVVKTFHVNSLHQGIDPTLIQVVPKHFYQAGIKLQSDRPTSESIQAALTAIEKVWKATFPNSVFEYQFLDETLAQAYHNETRTGRLIETATGVAILIACLGLFGLAIFTAEARTKEIGVRKVLGASVGSIVALLSRDFLKPVLVALVLATPIAWYGVGEWLKNFEYKINIEWWVFALAGGLAVGIALLTVSFQSVKAALTNPVKSLRTE